MISYFSRIFKPNFLNFSSRNLMSFLHNRDTVLNLYEERWKKEQNELKKQLITKDDFNFYIPKSEEKLSEFSESKSHSDTKPPLKYIGGVDISHNGMNEFGYASCGIVIYTYPQLDKVFEKTEIVKYDLPYISGFLAFREVEFFINLLKTIKNHKYYPQLIIVDGNGILHHRGFGLASHLGVLLNIPTIGIGKNLLITDEIRKEFEDEKAFKSFWRDNIIKNGKHSYIIQNLCCALRCSAYIKGKINDKLKHKKNKLKLAINPIYVSIGHKISLKTSIKIIKDCCLGFKEPEPTRIIDFITREQMRKIEKDKKKFFNQFENCNKNWYKMNTF